MRICSAEVCGWVAQWYSALYCIRTNAPRTEGVSDPCVPYDYIFIVGVVVPFSVVVRFFVQTELLLPGYFHFVGRSSPYCSFDAVLNIVQMGERCVLHSVL